MAGVIVKGVVFPTCVGVEIIKDSSNNVAAERKISESMIEVYLDIETTGLSPTYDCITVVGLYFTDGSHHRVIQVIADEITKHKLLSLFRGVQVIYTYNGSRFDLPFIHSAVGIDLLTLFTHRDLMYDCWRCNLYGGLKAVEQQLGISRLLKGITGLDAVTLWHRYQDNRDQSALALLLQYNKQDMLNLKLLKEKLDIVRQNGRQAFPGRTI